MDVRCESCSTEYELDDSKLKKGGVTVKCANCGHMFKVRMRPEGTPPAPYPLADRTPAPEMIAPAPPAPAPGSGPVDSRTWMVRLEDGEVRTCTELATLQQWIVTGQVTRNAQISRNGKTWKPLGGIVELSAFFDVAEDAGRAGGAPPPAGRTPRSSGTPALGVAPPPARSSAPPPARGPSAASTTTFSPPPPPARPPAASAPPPPAAPRASAPRPAAPPPAAPPPAAPRASAPPPRAPSALAAATAIPAPADNRATGAWAVQKKMPANIPDSGPSGPTGGLAKGIPTTDAAFARGNQKLPFIPDMDSSTSADMDDDFEPSRGGAAKWVLLGSVVVILAAAATVYLLVFRDSGGGDTKQAQGPAPAPAAVADAAVPVNPTPTAEPVKPPPPAPVDEGTTTAIAAAGAAARADDAAALTRSAAALAALADADKAPAVLVARSRVAAALAQQQTDAAAAASGDAARPLRTQARKLAADALAWARAADKDGGDAAVAMADALRLDGTKSIEVNRWLRKARDKDPASREATWVEAMLLLRENQKLKARALLDKLAAGAITDQDVRVAFRLALLDADDKQPDRARAHLAEIAALQPGHAGSVALLARLEGSAAPPVEPPTSGGGGDDPGGDEGATYASLLRKANAKAESDDCKGARALYDRALDLNPAGVEALTGMGYCHIDSSEYSSAHAKFRAALGISPGYPGAMLGVAEAYARQGLKKQAIDAYQKFLAENPGHARAESARRQIEKLGGGEPPPDKPPDPPPGDPPPDKPVNPPPAAPPAGDPPPPPTN